MQIIEINEGLSWRQPVSNQYGGRESIFARPGRDHHRSFTWLSEAVLRGQI